MTEQDLTNLGTCFEVMASYTCGEILKSAKDTHVGLCAWTWFSIVKPQCWKGIKSAIFMTISAKGFDWNESFIDFTLFGLYSSKYWRKNV